MNRKCKFLTWKSSSCCSICWELAIETSKNRTAAMVCILSIPNRRPLINCILWYLFGFFLFCFCTTSFCTTSLFKAILFKYFSSVSFFMDFFIHFFRVCLSKMYCALEFASLHTNKKKTVSIAIISYHLKYKKEKKSFLLKKLILLWKNVYYYFCNENETKNYMLCKLRSE